MKTIIFATLLSVVCFTSCEKEHEGPVIRGKLVYTSCATRVVQILDPDHQQLGQRTWQQAPGTTVFENVFSVENSCYFDEQQIEEGEEFSFRVVKRGLESCAVCHLWDNPPGVSRSIRIEKPR